MFKRLVIFIGVLLYSSAITPIPQTQYDKQKALLGKKLFFDPILSSDKKISCASCHSFKHGGADNKAFSIGVYGRIDYPMNSPTVYNAVFNLAQFWNGRAKDLKTQAMMANQDKNEMDMDKETLERRINNIPSYKKLFFKVYNKHYITYDMVFDAIAEFEKALITPNSRFDKFLKGDKDILTKQEKRGYELFIEYGCITCHNGRNLGGNSYQKLGVLKIDKKIKRGKDRFEVTKLLNDKYVYKVPTLRNIELTAPYFHNGSVRKLKYAVAEMALYNLGIRLTKDDLEDIVAFLKTLTGQMPEILKNSDE